MLQEACRRLRVRGDTGVSAVAFWQNGSGFEIRTPVNGGTSAVREGESCTTEARAARRCAYIMCVGARGTLTTALPLPW